MYRPVLLWALVSTIVLMPIAAIPQELALAGAPAIVLPSAPPALSTECRPKRSVAELIRRPLRALRRAVYSSRQIRVLAIGSSSTVGVGASSPSATYVARLETTLEGALKGMDFDVIGRGLSGEVAQGAADRMRREVEDTKPNLVVWQVGTNDALRHVGLDQFKSCLRKTLAWLAESKIDVVLVNPQYGDQLVKDQYYAQVVAAVAEIAKEMHVLLVDRFQEMRELQRERGDTFYLTPDNLHLNDVGYRCMAEQLARSIVAALLQTDADAAQPVFQP